MKKQTFKYGDIFAVQLPNQQYIFGRILFDVQKQCSKKGVEVPGDSYLSFFAGCILIEMYRGLFNEPIYQPSDVLIPGAFTSTTLLKNGTWPIVAYKEVDPSKVDFPEALDNSTKICFQKGELSFPTQLTEDDYEKINIQASIDSPYTIGAMSLHYLGLRHLIEEDYLYDKYLENSDFRYNPTLRTSIYNKIGEDSQQSYYQMAKKHGLDLARLY